MGDCFCTFNLTEQEDFLIKNSEEVTKELNSFSSCIVKKLFISNPESHDSVSEDIDHLTLEAIVKRGNHLGIFAMASEHENSALYALNAIYAFFVHHKKSPPEAKIDLKVPRKSCDKTDYDMIKFIL